MPNVVGRKSCAKVVLECFGPLSIQDALFRKVRNMTRRLSAGLGDRQACAGPAGCRADPRAVCRGHHRREAYLRRSQLQVSFAIHEPIADRGLPRCHRTYTGDISAPPSHGANGGHKAGLLRDDNVSIFSANRCPTSLDSPLHRGRLELPCARVMRASALAWHARLTRRLRRV